MSATSSQRISFTQLVLDMGLADKKALLKAKKLIKERQAEGKKLTIARACVELEILTEKQAKKVQLELKRLKTGLASSSEFTDEPSDGGTVTQTGKAEKKKKAEKAEKAEKAPEAAEPSDEAKVEEKKVEETSDEAKVEKVAETSDEAKVEPAPSDEAKVEEKSDEAKVVEESDEAKVAEAPVEDSEEEARPIVESEPEAEAKVEVESESEIKVEPPKKGKKKSTEDKPEKAEAAPKKKSAEEKPTKKKSAEQTALLEKKGLKAEPEKKVEKKKSAEQKALKADPEKKADKKAEPESESESKPEAASESESTITVETPKAKAKLGAEIKLDSAKRASGIGKASAAARAKRKSPDDAAAPSKRPSQAPLLVLGGLVGIVLMGSGAFVALRSGGDAKPTDSASAAATPAPTAETPASAEKPAETAEKPAGEQPPARPKPAAMSAKKKSALSKWSDIGAAAYALAQDGRFKEALAKAEEFPQDLREEDVWTGEAAELIADCKKQLPIEESFTTAIAAIKTGDKKPIREWIRKLEGKGEHVDKIWVDYYRKQARAALGDEGYDKILDKLDTAAANEALEEVAKNDKVDESAVELAAHKAPEIKLRGNDARKSKFNEDKSTAEKNLAEAKKKLEAKRGERKKRWDAEASRAMKAAAKITPKLDGKEAKLSAYDPDGFTVKVGGADKQFTWTAAPAELGVQVKSLGVDYADARSLYDGGIYALSKGQFEDAKKLLSEAEKKDGSYKERIPDVEQFRQLFKTFRTTKPIAKLDADPIEATWTFEPAAKHETYDFKALAGGMNVELVGGMLQISTPLPMFRITAAKVHGEWRNKPELYATLGSASPAPFIGFMAGGDLYMVQFGAKTELRRWGGDKNAPAIASSEVRAAAGAKVAVKTELSGEKLKIAVKVDDRDCFASEVDWGEDPVQFLLGAEGHGQVRFDDIKVSGKLDEKWLKRAAKAGPSEVARVLGSMEADLEAKAVGAAGNRLPVSLSKTSAEDDVGLEGISKGPVSLVEEARALLTQGNIGIAVDKLKDASNQSPDFAAAHYLYAELAHRSPQLGGHEIALFKLEQAIAGIDDFYEAWACKGKVLVFSGREEDALPWIQKALERRPDYAPAQVAMSDYHVLRGEYTKALDLLELADVLAPGDPQVLQGIRMAKALAQGPAWAERKNCQSENYVLDTDFVPEADMMSVHLEAIRVRYEEAFGVLKNPNAKKRKASVLVFQEAEDYYQYSYLTTGDRKEETGGHFNPQTGQLLLFIDEDVNVPGNLHVVYHEGTHQWCHGNGVELPYWANEGIAEYVGGTILDKEGKIVSRATTNKFLKDRLKALSNGWKNRVDFFDLMNQDPAEFYSSKGSGNREADPTFKYAQAWTMVHFFMESGDEKLKKVFVDYLQRFREANSGDANLRQGMALTYVYINTFYSSGISMTKLQQKWECWVKKMCDEAGVAFPHEVKMPEADDEQEDEGD